MRYMYVTKYNIKLIKKEKWVTCVEWDTITCTQCRIKCIYYFFDFENTNKSWYMKNDFEWCLVYIGDYFKDNLKNKLKWISVLSKDTYYCLLLFQL